MQQRSFACFLIFLQAWLMWDYGRKPLVPLVASVLAVLSIPETFRFPLRGMRWNLAIGFVIALAVGLNIFSPARPMPGARWMIPGHFVLGAASVLLLLQVLENFRRRESGVLPAYYSLLSLLTVVLCFCRSYQLEDWPTLFWGSVAMATLVGLFLQSSRNQAAETGDLFTERKLRRRRVGATAAGIRMSSFGRWMLLVWSFAGITFGTWYFTGVLSRNVEYARFLLFPASKDLKKEIGSSLRYSDSASLGSVLDSQLSNPDGVALRVYTDFEPGYLRGRCFDTFENDEWLIKAEQFDGFSISRYFDATTMHQELPRVDELPPGVTEGEYGERHFQVTDELNGPWKKIEVENDPNRGAVFFTPLNADLFKVYKTIKVKVDRNKVLRSGAHTGHKYTAYLNRSHRIAESERPEQRAELLSIPNSLDPKALKLADRIFDGRQKDRHRFQAIESWFQENYRYSLQGIQFPNNTDKLSHFILEEPAAHCEFFASATTLLLRTQGIPTRYVTGYVATDLDSEYGDHYLALNRNAHAWVEAFDREERKWVIVESTPGIETVKDVWENVTAEDELAAIEAAAKIARSEAAASKKWFDFTWLQALLANAGNILQIVLSLILIALLVAFLLRRRYLDYLKRRRGNYDPRFAKLAVRLRGYDKRLLKLGVMRDNHETIHQFANRLRGMEGEPWIQEAADEFVNYARVRYSQTTAA